MNDLSLNFENKFCLGNSIPLNYFRCLIFLLPNDLNILKFEFIKFSY